MKKQSFVLTSMALVALAFGAASCGRGESAPAKEEKASVRVRAEAIAPASERARMELSGELVARDRIDVATKVAGRIVELPVTEGTVVRRGDVLARLDSPELASALAQSKAAEQAARLNAEMSERQAERFRRLAASEVVTARDLEIMEVAAAGAKAGHEQALAMATMSRQNLDYAVLRGRATASWCAASPAPAIRPAGPAGGGDGRPRQLGVRSRFPPRRSGRSRPATARRSRSP